MAQRRYFRSARPDAVAPTTPRGALLTVSQVRERLGLRTNGAVYWHIEHGNPPLPVRRIGRAIRVDEHELDAWTRRERQPERPSLVIVKGA